MAVSSIFDMKERLEIGQQFCKCSRIQILFFRQWLNDCLFKSSRDLTGYHQYIYQI